jgi:glucose-6-phosphate isomerase
MTVAVSAPSADPALVADLVADRVASRIAAGDSSLWGPAAQEEAAVRLGWVRLYETSRPLLAEIDALTADLRGAGLDRVVLCGMGGSSLAPEVITRTAGVELTVLDTTDPGAVRRALADRLERTVVVVSSKSGSTVETDSQRRAFGAAFRDADIEPGERMVVVTDTGSSLAALAEESGYRRVFLADSSVGGRYSALTAFGLVPSALAGVDVSALLDEAAAVASELVADDPANPALVLGAALGGGVSRGRDKVAIADAGSGIVGFADWAEQLIAESTGKDGTGLLPVAVGGVDAPEIRRPAGDVLPALATPAGTALRSVAHSAGRCCCGSTPRRWPDGSSGSTPSTSPTSRARRRPPAACSTPVPSPSPPPSSTAWSRCGRPPACSTAPPPCRAPSTRCWHSCRTTATSP